MSFLHSCTDQAKEKDPSYIKRALDTVALAHSGKLLIYTINPNDCISCLNAFRIIDERLSGASAPVVYVIAVNRRAEADEIRRQITYPDLRPAKNRAVIWSREVFDSINLSTTIGLPLTALTIYDQDRDTVIFARPVRQIEDFGEIEEKMRQAPK